MGIRSYQELEVWRLAMDGVKRVYQLTGNFPRDERFGLCSQLQRAAVSIPSNIAEGHARDSTKEFLYHISVAMGSLAEVETQVLLACELGYTTQGDIGELLTILDRIGRMLRGLKKSLKAKLL
ncbi:MAG: four helix bundle protein [Planctomycetes bacterium]|nr:four helix bundle protein [Planctomycetota bacterium]